MINFNYSSNRNHNISAELKNLLLSKLLVGLLIGFLMVGLPLYLTDLNLDLSNIGLVFGLATFFYALLSFYFGSSSDSHGRLRIGIISIAGMVISTIFFGIMPFLPLTIALVFFVVGKILLDLSDSVLRNMVKIRILDLTASPALGTGYGFLIFADSLGYGLGILLGAVLISAVSFQVILLSLAALASSSLFFYYKTGDIERKSERVKVWKLSNLTATSKPFRIVLLTNTVLLFGTYLVDFFGLPLYLKEIFQQSNEQIFLLLGVVWLTYGLFSRIGGRLYDRLGPKQLLFSLFMIGITSVLLALAKTKILFSALLILDFVFFSFADPARFALIGLVSSEKKGMLMSFFEFFSLLTAAVVMLFFEKLVAAWSFGFIFVLRGICQFIALGLVMLVYHKFAHQLKSKTPPQQAVEYE